MKLSTPRAVTVLAAAAGMALAASSLSGSAVAAGDGGDPATWTSVPAQPKVVGQTLPNVYTAQLEARAVAQGSTRLENGTVDIPFFGYDGNGPLLPAPNSNVEASKTEPDKNTYLVLRGQTGADGSYSYGTHFLFQGHETGTRGYLTRVNLDADAAHKVTLMADTYVDGSTLPLWDGSTWDPFAQRLLLTAEGSSPKGVSQATVTFPSKVEPLTAAFGSAGYEGVQNDSAGNVWLADDTGGQTVAGARIPNSFIFRFLPVDRGDLSKGGKLQALRVFDAAGSPITWQNVTALTQDVADLHTYGTSFTTDWVTVHDTATDTSGAGFNANLLARVAGATPFKRPENGVFRPGSGFTEFFFTETGDTNLNSTANAGFGGLGALFKLSQSGPSAATGTISVFFNGTSAVTGLDNITFLSDRYLASVEDAGDGVHTQRAALDSAYVFDTVADYRTSTPVRFFGEGRDPSATLDSAFQGTAGFQNDGDNEITGIHASDGDPRVGGILGAKRPSLFEDGWRLFWNQQHGDNTAWEILPRR